MHRTLEFLLHHGYALLLGWVFAEQLGMPVPSISLLLAKFLPGLGTVAPPLAGIFHMRPRRFLLFDALGSLLWAATFLGLGYVFSGQIERVAEHLASLGGWLLVLLLGALAAYIAYKFVARQRFLRKLRIYRIIVDELQEKLDSGEELVI